MPTLKEIHAAVGGTLQGDGSIEINGVGSLDAAGPGDIAPLDNPDYADRAQASEAGALLVSTKLAGAIDRPGLVHDFPLVAMNAIIESLGLAPLRQTGRHATAMIDPSAHIPESVALGPNVVIGPGVRLGERCVVQANVIIERGVTVGDDTILEYGCILHEGAEIGRRCTIGSNSVISRQGFGFTAGPRGPVRLIHVGRTIIGDDTHIGALCSIDRARFDTTSIGTMTGLDNQIHLGHNAHIGDRVYIAAQCGFAGHVIIGDDCEIGGQSGMINHTQLGNGARLGAKTGVMGDVPPGETWWGSPAKPLRLAMRMDATLRKITLKKRIGPRRDGPRRERR